MEKNIHIIPLTLILEIQLLQCVAEYCMRRIAMYSCNPAHMHACYQKYFSVMQCGVVCCRSVTRCVAVCCTRRIATYSCNPTHAHACYQSCSSVMQCDAVCCSVVQECDAVWWSVLHQTHSTVCM